MHALEEDLSLDDTIQQCRIYRHDDTTGKKIIVFARATMSSSVLHTYFERAVQLANMAVHVQKFDESIVDIRPCIDGDFKPMSYRVHKNL